MMARLIVLLLVWLALVLPAAAEPRLALVIGNADYRHTTKLDNPVNDAKLVAATLRKQQFDVSEHIDADLRQMRRALQTFFAKVEKAGKDAVVAVYYAGHGVQLNGANYLIPVDAEIDSESGVASDSIRADDIMQGVAQTGNRLNIVILDACRNNPFRGFRAVGRGLAQIDAPGGTMVAFSTAPGKVARDGPKGGNSPYTAALARTMTEPGLKIEDVFKRVRQIVSGQTKGEQVPWESSSLVGDFYPAGSKDPAPAPVVAPALASNAPSGAAETVRVCREVEGMSSISMLAVLERQHAGTPAADCISARIGELKGAQAAAAKAKADRPRTEVVEKPRVEPAPKLASSEPAPKSPPVEPSGNEASSNCRGLNEAACAALSGCTFVPAQVKDGKQSLGFCRAKPIFQASAGSFTPGTTFRDCADCPEMVVVPSGSFMMGSPSSEPGRSSDETQRKVTISQPFAVGKFEVTFAEWEACVVGGGCTSNRNPSDEGWGRGRRPVINVSWNDAREYLGWLSRKTGKPYRLLTEAEWEFAARAKAQTAYAWGSALGSGNANCDGCGSQWDNKQTAPVGSFKANAFGLHDMHGNVREWVQDCYVDYDKAPTDGTAASGEDHCARVLRGGSWGLVPQVLRAAERHSASSGIIRLGDLGFRLARTLSPNP